LIGLLVIVMLMMVAGLCSVPRGGERIVDSLVNCKA